MTVTTEVEGLAVTVLIATTVVDVDAVRVVVFVTRLVTVPVARTVVVIVDVD